MTVQEHVGAATNRLVAVGLAPRVAAFDAEVLARHVLGWTHATYLSSRREPPPEAFAHRYGGSLGSPRPQGAGGPHHRAPGILGVELRGHA